MRCRIFLLAVGVIVLLLSLFSPGSTQADLALQVTITPTVFNYLPFIAKNWPPTPTPTPTATATPTATCTPTPTATSTPVPIQFVGTTNQDKAVDFDVKSDFSAVTRFRIEYKVVCPGVTMEGWTEYGWPAGLPIVDRQFEIRSSPGGGVEDVFTGEFDPDFSTAQGTWLKWLIVYIPYPDPVCSNEGTWSASRQP